MNHREKAELNHIAAEAKLATRLGELIHTLDKPNQIRIGELFDQASMLSYARGAVVAIEKLADASNRPLPGSD